MARILRLALFALCAVACTTQNPVYCDEQTPCSDAERSFCDLNGALAGEPNTCIEPPQDADAAPPAPDAGPPCDAAGTFLACEGDDALECTAEGEVHREPCEFGCNELAGRCNECTPSTTVCAADEQIACDADGAAERTPCPLGCHGTEVRCNQMVPSNGLGTYLELTEEANDIVLTDGAIIDTDTGTVTNGDDTAVLIPSFEVPAPTDGVPIRVFVGRSWQLGDTTIAGGNALAIVSNHEIRLAGTLRLGAAGSLTGAACVGGLGEFINGTQGKSNNLTGNGGGGHRGAGGRGGNIRNAGDGATGGAAFPNPDLVPLRGGCRGGGSSGGHGGGGAQMVSASTIELEAAARIAAGGAGGRAGEDPGQAGGGGGSGGGILLEAPRVLLARGTILSANGGGGACYGGPLSAHGEDARPSTEPATGGRCTSANFSDGGTGGTGTVSPQPGGDMLRIETDRAAGSGGGAAGYVRINTRSGNFQVSSDTTVSPSPSAGTIVVQ